LLSAQSACAQEILQHVNYICHGEKLYIENCNLRDLSDAGTCFVGHPDHILPNGLMAYSTETRATLKKLLPTCQQPSAAEVARARAFDKKVADKQAEAEKKANDENDAIEARAQAAITGKKPQDADQKALNRCVTAGRLPATCMGNTLSKPFDAVIGTFVPNLTAPLPPGPNMGGNFEGPGGWRIEFDERSAMSGCGGLMLDQTWYTLAFKDGAAIVTIPGSRKKNIVLTMRPDGTLVGASPMILDGFIAMGDDQVPASRSCPAPVLSSKGAAPNGVDIESGFLKAVLSDGEAPPPPPGGLRMHGIYAGPGGIRIEFYPESAIIDCGDAAHAYPYEVRVNGSYPEIRLKDPVHPLLLSIKPDGSMDPGSGPYQVLGRTITGQSDNGDFTFAPLNRTCNLGMLQPNANPGSPPAALNGPPAIANNPNMATTAAPTGNAILTVISGLPTTQGQLNPLAGHPYVLLKDDLATALTKGGFPVPSGGSPFTVMAATCKSRTPECQKLLAAINADTASAIRADATGKASFPGVPPGVYYLMISGAYNNQLLYWGQKVPIHAGANAITLDQHNGVPVK
jgi:hypothetical protein